MHGLGSIKPEKIKSIEHVQKRAARSVHNNYTDRATGYVTNMVKSLKWENIEDRRKSARLCLIYIDRPAISDAK